MSTIWVKSSLSFSNGNCVEVASLPGGEIGVRHSRNSAGPVLAFTSDAWRAFLGDVRTGKFDGFSECLGEASGIAMDECDGTTRDRRQPWPENRPDIG